MYDGSATLITATEYRYNPQGIRVAKVVDDVIYTDYLIDPYNPTGYAQQKPSRASGRIAIPTGLRFIG